jgi:hypothetical protein
LSGRERHRALLILADFFKQFRRIVEALAALRLLSESLVHRLRITGTGPRAGAEFGGLDGVADAEVHERLLATVSQ